MIITTHFSLDGDSYVAGPPHALAGFPTGITQRISGLAACRLIDELLSRSDFKTLHSMLESVCHVASSNLSREKLRDTICNLVSPASRFFSSPVLAIRKFIPRAGGRAGRDVSIWVIGAPGDHLFDLAAGVASLGFQDYIRVDNIEDMVTKILERLEPGQRILVLKITDHGDSYKTDKEVKRVGPGQGKQYIGRDQISSFHIMPRFERALSRLNERLAPGAEVILEGCTVGQAERLLASASRVLGGTPVTGGTSYQQVLVPGMEGTIRTCMHVPDELTPTCWTDREASPLGKLNYQIQENVVIPSIEAMTNGVRELKDWVIEVTGDLTE